MKDYSFGNYICALRTGLGLSQFQLGTLVGVTDKAVSKWENGDAKPRISTCHRLAEVLGVTINELLSCKQYLNIPARKELDKMNAKLWNEAYERLSIYGENPPAVCWSRLAAEKAALYETDAIQSFAVLGKIEEEAQKNNSTVFAVGTIASSFTAWLLGATKVNPLPPHYRCPLCGKTEFINDATDGFDLPAKKCDCGAELIRDGHNIPFEGYAKAEQRRTSVDFRISAKFKPIAVEILKAYYEGKADVLPVKLVDEDDCQLSPSEIYVILNGSREKPELSADGFWHAGNEEYWDWWENETAFTIISDNRLQKIQILQEQTNTRIPDPIKYTTPHMAEALYNKRCSRSAYITAMVEKLGRNELHDFSLVMKIDGFAHGSALWSEKWLDNGIERSCSNGEKLVVDGRATFRAIPAFREEIWNDISNALARNGIRDNGLAIQTMETARKGLYYSQGMPVKVEKLLISLGLPEWYPEYLKKVRYLFPKGHCVSLLLLDIILEWYCINYPEEYKQLDNFVEP